MVSMTAFRTLSPALKGDVLDLSGDLEKRLAAQWSAVAQPRYSPAYIH